MINQNKNEIIEQLREEFDQKLEDQISAIRDVQEEKIKKSLLIIKENFDFIKKLKVSRKEQEEKNLEL
jgi:hypothetical protein